MLPVGAAELLEGSIQSEGNVPSELSAAGKAAFAVQACIIAGDLDHAAGAS